MDKGDKKINIVSVKWGSKYSSEHVNRLYNMVNKNLTYDFNFYCLTEDITGCLPTVTQLPLEDDGLVGWWNKLYLFKENFFGLEGTILYFDLDIIIVNSIDFLIEQETEFLICKDWTSRDRDMWNSSIMKFDVGNLFHVWENFVKDRESIVAKYHGDQDWIYDCIPSATIIDETRVVSFK